MLRRFACLAPSLLLALILISLGPALAQDLRDKIGKDQRPQIRAGDIPPDFTREDLDGAAFTLSEMQGEMPVVIDFWATWCGPCRSEIPLLNEFARKHGDEVAVVAITSEDIKNAEAVREFVEEQELVFRVIHDPSGDIAKSYYVHGIPYLIVIGVDGVAVATHLGYSEDVIEKLERELGIE
jgi:thiol-disulfide isomerase/thioredoxin